MAKRIFDVLVAIGLLILFAPILAIIAILVKRDTPGPVYFKQKRVGQYGRPFQIYKFRTMVDAPRSQGPQVTAGSDPRITKTGRILRNTKLDELPQLINIIKGDMSFVGPRPEVPAYVEHWTDHDRQLILSLRPGITDPATIKFRDEEGLLASAENPEEFYLSKVLPEKLALYREYVATRTFCGDIALMFKTVARIFSHA
ncbi:MAG: sugar transferase [Hyphomicrobiaceae bacterium]